jgi:prepilin-type N-terminal cleavage/methylation domain-containing protein
MSRGFSLVEMLIVTAVFTLFFGGLFVTIQNSLRLITASRERVAAISVASDQLEYIRSLSYDAVGTVNGLPSGLIPQISTTTLNGIVFTRRTLVEFVDDPADGLDAADTNAITTDYKRAKVEVLWLGRYGTSSVSYVTTVVPRSIETDLGGGTIRITVRDADVAPVSGAAVRLLNTTGTTTVDVTKYTDATGIVLFGGAPAGANYQVFVTRPGYSSDGTAVATGTLANPAQQPLSVVAADVTSATYFIDELASLAISVYSDRSTAVAARTGTSFTDVASTSNTIVTGSGVTLLGVPGSYSSEGTVFFTPISPTSLFAWAELRASTSVPSNTEIRYRLYTASSTTYTLIPDSDLPGNAAGFLGIVPLAALSAGTYPSVVVGATLQTTDTSVTPLLENIALWYIDTATPRANSSIEFTGAKVLGTTVALATIPKQVLTRTSNASGSVLFSGIEWDIYTLTNPAHVIRDICGAAYPLVANPGATTSVIIVTGPTPENSLRVGVTHNGVAVPGASVTLSDGIGTNTTSVCGHAYFHDVPTSTSYTLTVSAPGFAPVVLSPYALQGNVVEMIAL